jgi:hypothetical protein
MPWNGRRAAEVGVETIPPVDVSAVTLFHSRLSPAGPTYTALAHAQLTGAGLD